MSRNREESQLPGIFYRYIDRIPNNLWLKFVRLLGLPNAELQNIINRQQLGNSEWKYQALDRWKTLLGNRSDAAYEAFLLKACDEVERHFQYEMGLPDHLQSGVALSRAIYQFIDEHNGEEWKRLVHVRFGIPGPDISLLQQTYADDYLETKYQTILKYMVFHKINQEDLPGILRSIRPVVAGER